MASTTISAVAFNIKLNNGTSSTGAIKTLNVPLGGTSSRKVNATLYSTNESTFLTKAMNVAYALEPCFEKSIYSTQLVVTSDVSN